jgi:hypothetical protein
MIRFKNKKIFLISGIFFLAVLFLFSASPALAAGCGKNQEEFSFSSFFTPFFHFAEKAAKSFGYETALATAPDPDFCGSDSSDSVACSGTTPLASVSWEPAPAEFSYYILTIGGVDNFNVGLATSYTVSSGLANNTTYNWSVEAYYNGASSASQGYTNQPSGSFTTPNCATPKGYHDGSDCSQSVGWACDADNYNQALDIHFYRDGPAGGGGTFIGSVSASQPREAGVGAECGGNSNHGFIFATPDSLKDGNSHAIYAYVINIGSGTTNPLLTNSPKTINCAPPPPPPPPPPVLKPHINLSPTSFSFSGVSGSATPAGQTLNISNTGNAALNWTGTTNQDWCDLSSGSGYISVGGNSDITIVSVDAPTNVGSFGCTITISGANADNSPQTASVVYNVSAAPVACHCSRCSVINDRQWVEFNSTDSTCATVVPSSNPVTQTLNCTCRAGNASWYNANYPGVCR